MGENPYQPPRTEPNEPSIGRLIVLPTLGFLSVPAAAILAGTTCGATFFRTPSFLDAAFPAVAGIVPQIASGTLTGVIVGFVVLLIALLIASLLETRQPRAVLARFRCAFVRMLMGIPIGIGVSVVILGVPLFVLPQAWEAVLLLGPYVAGSLGFLALAITYWSGWRKAAMKATSC
jgi:hypothetical protein